MFVNGAIMTTARQVAYAWRGACPFPTDVSFSVGRLSASAVINAKSAASKCWAAYKPI